MRRPCRWARRMPTLMLALAALPHSLDATAPAAADQGEPKDQTADVRWDEKHPGCTFSRSDDGRFHYGLWSGDVGVTLSVDSQELEKVNRRHEPFFAVRLEVRYRGQSSLEFGADDISLEFLKHFGVVETALDPDALAQKVQNDVDEMDHRVAREVQKHPARKEAKEAYLRVFQKEAAELLEFISQNSLRPARLGPNNPETQGWVLFSVGSKWINAWKRQEGFLFRVPIEGRVFEFPFELPPKPGEMMLRKRQ